MSSDNYYGETDDDECFENRRTEALNSATPYDGDDHEFSAAMYAAYEMGLVKKLVDGDEALRIWRVIESVRLNGFSKDLWL